MADEIKHPYVDPTATLYAVIRDDSGQVWDPAAQVFETFGAGGHTNADYDIAMTDAGGGFFTADFDANIPEGSPGYWVTIYLQAGGSPADPPTDLPIGQQFIDWDGSAMRNYTQGTLRSLTVRHVQIE